VRRVSPLLFIAAFDYAPYPGTAGRRFSLSRFFCPVLACTHGDSPFHPSITESQEAIRQCHSQQGRALCDLSLSASLHWHIMVAFLCQSQNSRPKPFRHPCVQWWRDFPHDMLSRRLLFLSRLLHGLLMVLYVVACGRQGGGQLALVFVSNMMDYGPMRMSENVRNLHEIRGTRVNRWLKTLALWNLCVTVNMSCIRLITYLAARYRF